MPRGAGGRGYGARFASGLAATSMVVDAARRRGSRGRPATTSTAAPTALFDEVFQRFGLTSPSSTLSDPRPSRRRITPKTKLVWIETPTNPHAQAHGHRAPSPSWRSKQGVMVCVGQHLRDARTSSSRCPRARIWSFTPRRSTSAATPTSSAAAWSPATRSSSRSSSSCRTPWAACRDRWTASCCLRGIKTLAIRMERHAQNARRWPSTCWPHPEVAKVHYPGLPTHPGTSSPRSR